MHLWHAAGRILSKQKSESTHEPDQGETEKGEYKKGCTSLRNEGLGTVPMRIRQEEERKVEDIAGT